MPDHRSPSLEAMSSLAEGATPVALLPSQAAEYALLLAR
jgi:hypothetical protein